MCLEQRQYLIRRSRRPWLYRKVFLEPLDLMHALMQDRHDPAGDNS